MALTTSPQSPSTGPVALTAPARPARLRAIQERALVLWLLVVDELVAALRPDEADFRLPHVAVIVASLVVLAGAAVAGVFHR